MSTGGGGPPPYVGYSQQQQQQAGQYGVPPPQQPPQPPQQQAQAQAQASATAANPDVFVRRLYKPRLHALPSLGAGVVAQLASLSKRGAAAAAAASQPVDLLTGGGSGSTQQQQQPEVLPSEVAQSEFLLSPTLALPEEFGKIYLGETFSAYVSIVNTLPHPILLLEAQASLKSSRSSEILLNNMAPLRAGHTTAPLAGLGIGRDRPRELQPGENLDVVVEHVLQELDWHYLAIKLEFLDARGGVGVGGGDGPPRPMMKRFKFKVYNPVAITTTHRLISGGGGGGAGQQDHHAESEVLIQAQVKNITERHTSLMLEDVAFVAEDGFVAEPLRSLDPLVEEGSSGGSGSGGGDPAALSPARIRRLALSDDDGRDEGGDGDDDPCDCVRAFDRHVYLQPDDVVQFLYRLRRAESPYKGRTLLLAAGMPLGQLRVSWRTTLGEAGTLLSPRVLCSAEAASAPRPVELRLEAPLAPPEAGGGLVQGEVYTARCALANNTERDLWLQVQFHLEAMQGVYVTGKAFQNAGLVPARSTRPLAFQLLPLMAGLHEVKGVTIVDLVSAQEFHQDRLCEVMVVRREDGEGEGEGEGDGAGLVAVGSGLEHVLGSN